MELATLDKFMYDMKYNHQQMQALRLDTHKNRIHLNNVN